ncbi:MAG: beta-N-acetylhexosaminidase [Thermoprotei archaeon]|nr:MAG: beta-N-acetylhexosaminidase [Thermoprotei archaeon]
MDIDLIAGQTLMVGFEGKQFDDKHLEMLRDLKPSGIILFARNVENPRQVCNLIKDFQDEAKSIGIPELVVSADQEGWPVLRFTKGFTFIPSQMCVAATGSKKLAYKLAKVISRELKIVGVNLNLAPVLDINTDPDNPVIGVRSFGDDPRVVAEYGETYIKAFQEEGVGAVGKHFPGHGGVNVDSHYALPILDVDLNTLRNRELIPFRRAVEADVSSIMLAHISVPKIDDSRTPATFSKPIIDVLKKELGFKGLIMTDALEMKAISDNYEPKDVAIKAINAGVDLLLSSHSLDLQYELKESIVEGVKKGLISTKRLKEIYLKIQGFRERFPWNQDSLDGLRSREHTAVSYAVTKRAVTLVHGTLPKGFDEPVVLIPKMGVYTPVEEEIKEEVSELISGLEVCYYETNPSEHEIKELSERFAYRNILLILAKAQRYRGQLKLVEKIGEVALNLVVAAGREPYDLTHVKIDAPKLAIYTVHPTSIKALLEHLTEKTVPEGRLPVRLPSM